MNEKDTVQEFMYLYRSVYKYLHSVKDKHEHYPTSESIAVIRHLTLSGPLTISEAAKHFDRAQSAMSELIDRLQANGYVDRVKDSRDKRRTLVWLTPEGHRIYEKVQEVLSKELLTESLGRLSDKECENLLTSLRSLVAASQTVISKKRRENGRKS